MDTEIRTFWISVIAGVIAMVVFAFVTINIYHLIPIISPFVGGLVTGLIVRRDAMSSGKAGVVAGIVGGIVIIFDFLLGTKLLENLSSPLAVLAGGFMIIVAVPYYAIFAFIGGVAGGIMAPRKETTKK